MKNKTEELLKQLVDEAKKSNDFLKSVSKIQKLAEGFKGIEGVLKDLTNNTQQSGKGLLGMLKDLFTKQQVKDPFKGYKQVQSQRLGNLIRRKIYDPLRASKGGYGSLGMSQKELEAEGIGSFDFDKMDDDAFVDEDKISNNKNKKSKSKVKNNRIKQQLAQRAANSAKGSEATSLMPETPLGAGASAAFASTLAGWNAVHSGDGGVQNSGLESYHRMYQDSTDAWSHPIRTGIQYWMGAKNPVISNPLVNPVSWLGNYLPGIMKGGS